MCVVHAWFFVQGAQGDEDARGLVLQGQLMAQLRLLVPQLSHPASQAGWSCEHLGSLQRSDPKAFLWGS